MATYHCSCGKCNKGKGASAAASYDYISRERKYKIKEGFLCGESGNLPEWCGERAREYWYQADRNERANSNVARKLEFALPNEIEDIELQKQLVRDVIAKACNGDKLAWSYAIHTTAIGNIHAHVMISERIQDNFERTPEQFFKRANKKNPKKGGCRKTEFLKKREFVKYIRKEVADLVNALYVSQKIEARVDERSYVEQGIDKVPSVHMGPQLKEMEERGVESYVLADRREKAAERSALLTEERRAAWISAWEGAESSAESEIRYLITEYDAYAAEEEEKQENARRVQADNEYAGCSEPVNVYLNRMSMDTAELKFLAKGKKDLYFIAATGDGSEPVVHFRPRGRGFDNFVGAGAFLSKIENTYMTRTDLSYFDTEVKRLTEARKEAERSAADNKYSKISEHVLDFLKRVGRTAAELKSLAKGKKDLYFIAATGDGTEPVVHFTPKTEDLESFSSLAVSYDGARNVWWRKDSLSDYNNAVKDLTEERLRAEEQRRKEEADARYLDGSVSVAEYCISNGLSSTYLKVLERGNWIYCTAPTGDGGQPVIRLSLSDLKETDAAAWYYRGTDSVYVRSDTSGFDAEADRLTKVMAARKAAEEKRRADELAARKAEEETDASYTAAVLVADYHKAHGKTRLYGKIVGRGREYVYAVVAAGDGSAPVIRVDKDRIGRDAAAISVFSNGNVYGKDSTREYDAEVKRLEKEYREEQARKAVREADERYRDAPDASSLDMSYFGQRQTLPMKIVGRGAHHVYCEVPVGEGDAPVVRVSPIYISEKDVAVIYSIYGTYGKDSTEAYDTEVSRLRTEAEEERARKASDPWSKLSAEWTKKAKDEIRRCSDGITDVDKQIRELEYSILDLVKATDSNGCRIDALERYRDSSYGGFDLAEMPDEIRKGYHVNRCLEDLEALRKEEDSCSLWQVGRKKEIRKNIEDKKREFVSSVKNATDWAISDMRKKTDQNSRQISEKQDRIKVLKGAKGIYEEKLEFVQEHPDQWAVKTEADERTSKELDIQMERARQSWIKEQNARELGRNNGKKPPDDDLGLGL